MNPKALSLLLHGKASSHAFVCCKLCSLPCQYRLFLALSTIYYFYLTTQEVRRTKWHKFPFLFSSWGTAEECAKHTLHPKGCQRGVKHLSRSLRKTIKYTQAILNTLLLLSCVPWCHHHSQSPYANSSLLVMGYWKSSWLPVEVMNYCY